MLLPNVSFHAMFGKVLFVLFDILVGLMLYEILRRRAIDESLATFSVAVGWLLNPLVINISTRGNAESVIAAVVVTTLYFLEQKREIIAAIL